MNTVYVLMEEGWDYNDETYFQSGNGGGHPKAFFLSEEEANKECDARNLKSFKALWANGDIREYCYSIDDLRTYSDRKDKEQKKLLEQTCEKLFGMDWDELDEAFQNQDEIPKTESGTDADWKQLFDLLTLNFWNVVKVEKATHNL